MIKIRNSKGVSEIISSILIMLIVVIVVGIIIGGVLPEISASKEKINYDNSIKVRDAVYSGILDAYNLPIDGSKELEFSIPNITVDINADVDKVEVCSIGKHLRFFDNGITINEDNNKYSYRSGQIVCACFNLENIDITPSHIISNKENTRIILKKTDINTITISLENETTEDIASQKNYIYEEEE